MNVRLLNNFFTNRLKSSGFENRIKSVLRTKGYPLVKNRGYPVLTRIQLVIIFVVYDLYE